MSEALVLRSATPETTRAIAAAMAPLFRPGDVVSLTGELGAGKTCFVQGLARALGVPGRVTSPTFMLVRTYDGEVPIVHCDVYRLDRLQDVLDLGEDVMSPDALTLIEWGDAVTAILPSDRLEVSLTLGDDPGVGGPETFEEPERIVTIEGHGLWALRLPDIAAAVADWRLEPGQAAPPADDLAS